MQALPFVLLLLFSALIRHSHAAQFCDGTLILRGHLGQPLQWSIAATGHPTNFLSIAGTEVCTKSFVADGDMLWCMAADATIHSFALTQEVAQGAPPAHVVYPQPAAISPIDAGSTLLYWKDLKWGLENELVYSLICAHNSAGFLACGIPNPATKSFDSPVQIFTDYNAVTFVRGIGRVIESRIGQKWLAGPYSPAIGAISFANLGIFGLWSSTVEIWTDVEYDWLATSGDGYIGFGAGENRLIAYDAQLSQAYNLNLPANGTIVETTPTVTRCENYLIRIRTDVETPTEPSASRNVILPSKIMQRNRLSGFDTPIFEGMISGMTWTPSLFTWPSPPPSASPTPVIDYTPTPETSNGPQSPAHQCRGSPPNDFFVCRDGAWWANVSVTAPSVIIYGATTLGGSLFIANSTTFNGIYSSVSAANCYYVEGEIILSLTEEEYKDLLKHKSTELHLIRGQECSSNSTSRAISASIKTTAKSSCKKVSIDIKRKGDGVYTIINVNSTKCNIWWIVLICVFAVLLIAALVIAFVFTHFKKCRQTVRPYAK